MQKVMQGMLASAFIALCALCVLYIRAIKDLEHEVYKNVILESKIHSQNQALQKLKLETQSYKENKEKQEKQIQAKYEKVLTKTQKVYINTCDIQELERLKKQELQLSELLRVRYDK